eukprot:TRINITY_DN15377_c0_g1_i1.p1 TRINITY_DN15377_c0_g1~~TRINITY_DN15377_c0_g1_i1.p1  ORF type:complete len:338 (+),score=49.20 TRINITY_DN15377_c0_g1_i1:27-1016(+)
MYPFILSLFLFIFISPPACAIYVSLSNPYSVGELTSSYLAISDLPDISGWLNVYYPPQPGTYATILFITGLDSDVPGGYSTISSHLNTHGIIAIDIQFLLRIPSDDIYLDYVKIAQFLKANLSSYLPQGVIGDVDNNLVMMGHSAGCKIVVKTLEMNCGLCKASILLNPVDGLDPWGWINDYVTHPPNLVNYTVPTLILGAGLDPVPGHEDLPACAPAGRNYERFFECLRPNLWLLNATQFGHADFLDTILWESLYYTQFCKTTTQVDNRIYYQQFVGGLISAFVIGIIQRNCDAMKYVTDTSTFPIPLVTVNVTKSTDYCPKPVCLNQ